MEKHTTPNMWLAKKASAAYRQKRFLFAATIRAWYRWIGVLVSLGILLFVIRNHPSMTVLRACYVPIALGYVWLDVHFGSAALQLRYEGAKRDRTFRKKRRLFAKTNA